MTSDYNSTPPVDYAGTYFSGAFESTDGFNSYRSASIPGLGFSTLALASDDSTSPATVYAGILYLQLGWVYENTSGYGGTFTQTNLAVQPGALSALAPPFAGALLQFHPIVGEINPTGTAVLFSTYLAGTSWDEGQGIAVDPAGDNIYLAGTTFSSDFPIEPTSGPGPVNPSYDGFANGFIARIALNPSPTPSPSATATAATPTPIFSPATPTRTPTPTLTPTPTPSSTPTATPTLTATATPTATPTVTATATATPTVTPLPPQTPTPTESPTPMPTPTPGFVCEPASGAVAGLVWEAAKASSGKPPTFKSISFGKQALGTTSASVNAALKNTTTKALTVTAITLKGNSGDFGENDGCTGQTLQPNTSCYISAGFKPLKAGARSATLSITTLSGASNGPKVSAKLSGTGVAPQVASLSAKSLAAFSQVTLKGSGFAPNAPVLVTFTEKLKGKTVLAVPEAAVQNNGASILVTVPPVIDQATGGLVAGSAALSVQETLSSGTLSSKSPSLKITVPPSNGSLSPEQATLAFLQGEQGFAEHLETAVVGTQLASLSGSLGQLVGSLGALISSISNSTATTTLGSVAGVNVTVDQGSLTTAETQLLAMLMTLAGGGGSQSAVSQRAIGPQAIGSGCMAAKAQQALSDTGNPTLFTSDIAQMFLASQTSPACQQPGAAAAAAGIVNGAVSVALGVISQADKPQVAALAPAEALVYANLGPGGQLISIGVSLAQTSPQARQAVESSAQTFNQGSSSQVTTVVTQSQGPLQNTYSNTSQTATTFDQAAPPFDGTYSGSFTGTQFFTGGNSCSISGAIGLGVAGSTITATAPGAGSGMLNNDGGSFTIDGIGGAGGSCSFTGTFSVDATGAVPPSASGTWSCTAPSSSSGFISANGAWSASKQ